MKIFDHRMRSRSLRHAELARRYEIGRTFIEFLAAVAFIIGSVFFFYPGWVYAGTWLFLAGSVFFAIRPTVRLVLELHLARLPGSDENPEAAGDS